MVRAYLIVERRRLLLCILAIVQKVQLRRSLLLSAWNLDRNAAQREDVSSVSASGLLGRM